MNAATDPLGPNLRLNPTRYFLALGDSYTIGEGVEPHERFPAQLAKMLATSNLSVSEPTLIARTGWTGQDLLSAHAAENFDRTYQLVTLLIGVNNQYGGQAPGLFRIEFKKLLRAAVQSAGGNSKSVVVLSIPDWGATPFAKNRDRERIAKEIDVFNGVCRSECLAADIVFVDITGLSRKLSEDPYYFAADGLHFSGRMYQAWAALLFPRVAGILRNSTSH